MTDAQFALLISAIAGGIATVVGALKWAVGRITKSIDDNSSARDRQAESQLELAKAMTMLSVKIDTVTDWVQDHTPVGGTQHPEPASLPAPLPPPPRRSTPVAPRTNTPVRGVQSPAIERHRTRGDDDR